MNCQFHPPEEVLLDSGNNRIFPSAHNRQHAMFSSCPLDALYSTVAVKTKKNCSAISPIRKGFELSFLFFGDLLHGQNSCPLLHFIWFFIFFLCSMFVGLSSAYPQGYTILSTQEENKFRVSLVDLGGKRIRIMGTVVARANQVVEYLFRWVNNSGQLKLTSCISID